VQPNLSEMNLEEPEIFRQGNNFGVRLMAKAPSLHIIKTDITTEVSPVVGSLRQSEDLIQFLLDEFEEDPSKIWETNIFGKSLYDMVIEQMESKLTNVPENIRTKVQRSLQKVSDEGKEHMLCVVL
ncbi:MAG TPA: sporulation stage IV protein A, partial [Anaerovoracaceae bacterium]|nr:sporulation stage IV protein A [Anaerovoracaceae bacterium]